MVELHTSAMTMIDRRTALATLSAVAAAPTAWSATPASMATFKQAAARFMSDGRYLPVWETYTSPAVPRVDDAIEQWAAMMGDEKAALVHAVQSRGGPAPDLSGATAEDAVQAIVHASRGRRVVMLNEAHVASRHRMFLADVLRALRQEGFTHFAAETFGNDLEPGGPRVERLRAGDRLQLRDGFYTTDPVFGEAVREALDLGYRLVAYEQREDQAVRAQDPLRIERREHWQAANFAEAVARTPAGRFIVYVGYGHIELETPSGWAPAFANLFWRRTGIRPLTALQANSGSFGPHGPDRAAITAVLKKFAPLRPIVVRSAGGEVMGVGPGQDLSIVHPSLPDVDGRPGWLAAAHSRRRAEVALPPRPAGLALAQAVHAGEPDACVPADQYLLAAEDRRAVFYLRPGRYQVRIEAPAGFTAVQEIAV